MVNILNNYDTNLHDLKKCLLTLNYTISFESYMTLMRVKNKKNTNSNKVRAM